MKLSAWLATILLFAGCSTKKDDAMQLTDIEDSKYQVGQVWKYKARPEEPNSTFTVLKVENWPKTGTIVHVRVDDVRIHVVSEDTLYKSVDHMPFSKEAIDLSALTLLKTSKTVPDFSEGYEQWREAFLLGKAGVFSITLKEGVKYMEQTINQGKSVKE
jgi:hypothetical protein